MPRPDGQPDKLGLAILDEPAAQQTDPTVRVQMLIHACVDQESVSTRQTDMASRHRQAYSCEGITGAGSAIAGNLHTGSAAAHGGAVGRKCCREPPEDHHLDAGVCLSWLPTMFVCGIFSRAHMRARAHARTHALTHSLTHSLTHHTHQNMADLHRGNPAPKVDYTRAMPDIEQLMQMWSPEMEEVLEQVSVPESVAALLSCVG